MVESVIALSGKVSRVLFVLVASYALRNRFVPPRLRAGKASPAEYVTEDVYDWTKRINEFARDEVSLRLLHREYFLQSNPLFQVEQYKLQLLPYLAKLSSSEITTASAASLLWDIGGSYEHAQPGSRLVQCGMMCLNG